MSDTPIFDDLLARTRARWVLEAMPIEDVAERHAIMNAALDWSPLPELFEHEEIRVWGKPRSLRTTSDYRLSRGSPHSSRTLKLNMWETP